MRKHEQGPICGGCEEFLKQGHPRIVAFFHMMKERYPTIHTSDVYRNEEKQLEAFKCGASKLIFPKSAHNKLPSRAIDIFQINEHGKGIWDPGFCKQIHVESKAEGFDFIWGGEFKTLGDSGHFELSKDELLKYAA